MHYSLLITPLSQSAFFKESTEIAAAEVEFITGIKPERRQVGTLEFLEVDFEGTPQTLSRLSTIAGIFSRTETGSSPSTSRQNLAFHASLSLGPNTLVKPMRS